MSQLPYTWTGEVFKPLLPTETRQTFEPGKRYLLCDRSEQDHKHHFAWLNAAWKNLPEDFKDQFPTPNHLRKAALIQAGFYNEEIIDVGTTAGALRVASWARGKDDFSHIVARGGVVVVRTAKSQKRAVQDAKEWRRAKEAVREIVAHMIGVTPDELENWKDAEI